jgi:hypothetical protein
VIVSPLPHDLLHGIAVYLEFPDVGAFDFSDSYKLTAGGDFKNALFAQ